ncbi:MAG: MSCRAMM family protein [Acidobacteriota bacterium]
MKGAALGLCLLGVLEAAAARGEVPSAPPEVKAVPGPVAPLSEPQPPCGEAARVTAIVPSADGLDLQGEGPFHPAPLRAEGVSERGLSGFSRLILEIENARPEGLPPRLFWESGPFAEARLRLLRNPSGCPLLRVELLLRGEGPWEIVTEPKQLKIRRPAGRPGPGPTGGESLQAARSFRFSLGGALSELGGGEGRLRSGNVQLAYAQQTRLGLLRAFAASYSPRGAGSGAPYGGAALSAIPAGPFLLGAAAGDLQTTLGGGSGTFLSPTTLLLRGGAVTLSRGGVRLAVFSGQAASPALTRLPDASGVLPEIGPGHLRGAEVSFAVEPLRLEVAAGLLQNRPQGEKEWQNAFLSLAVHPVSEGEARLLLEGSSGGGWAATVEPRLSGPTFSLGGYYRYAAKDFRPPLGTSLFASLRHGYNLYGTSRLAEGLTATLALSQSKSFSLFDPAAVGTLSSNQTASLGWAAGRGFTAGIFASRSESRSDPGAAVPTRARSENAGLSLSWGRGSSSASLRLSRERVRDDFRRNQDLTALRLDGEGRHTFGGGAEGRLLFRFYDGQRPSGERVNRYYEARAEGRWRLGPSGALSLDLGLSETPPGPALVRVRQESAGAGLDLGAGGLRGSLRVSAFRQEVEGRRPRNGFLAQVNLGGLFQRGARPPAAPAEGRALPLPFEAPEAGTLRVLAFWDENGNGLREPGEAPLPAAVLLDGRRRLLSAEGEGRFALLPGRHRVEAEWSGPLVDGFLPQASHTVEVEAGRTLEVTFPVRPAGRVEGRLAFQGTLPSPGALAQVRITASAGGVLREAVTDEQGFFSFGPLPEGKARIVLDGTTLAEGVVAAGPTEQEVTIVRKETTQTVFSLRAATARERILK